MKNKRKVDINIIEESNIRREELHMDHKKLEAYRKEYQGVEMSEKDYQ